MRSAVRRMGSSSGVIIPKPLLAAVGAQLGDAVEVSAVDGRIVIAPIRADPRAGWSDDAKRIVEGGDGSLVWPEFGNEGDAALKW